MSEVELTELTVEELEKATRETLRALAKNLQILSEQKDVSGVHVNYQMQRPLTPQYEELAASTFKRFLGLKQTGPKTMHIAIHDYTRDGLFVRTEAQEETDERIRNATE